MRVAVSLFRLLALETELPTQLDDAPGRRLGNLAETRVSQGAVRVRSSAAPGRRQSSYVDVVLRVIERVERFDTECKTDVLREDEVFNHPDVPVVDAWLPEEVARRVSVDSDRRLGKARGIDPLVQSSREPAIHLAARCYVSALSDGIEKASAIGCKNRIGKAFLKGRDAGGFPATDYQVFQRVHVAQKFLPTTYWEVIDVAGDKTLIHVEVRWAVICLRIVIIPEALVSRACGAHTRSRRLIIQTSRPGIDGGDRPLGIAMFHLEIHGVVVRIAMPVAVDVRSREISVRLARTGGAVVRYICGVSLAKRQICRGDPICLSNVAPIE
jgi:hypothetical protein